MSETLTQILNRLLEGGNLSENTARDLMFALTDPELDTALSGALLAALRAKGETADEIRGFAKAMRELAIKPAIPMDIPTVDTVGTGGDGSGSFNLSTACGLLSAACGIRVVKHGNRSISSRSGSADVLEALGLPVPLGERMTARCLEQTGFTFLYAPAYHPAMKAIAPVRGALGVRTVFNFLGPLSNPAAPPYQFIGAFSAAAAKLMADTLAGMPIERAFVVHGEPGWDEATPVGTFLLFDVRPGKVEKTVRDPLDIGLRRCAPESLMGGDAKENAAALKAVFDGADRGPHRDAILLGTGLVLELMGLVEEVGDGVTMAAEAIDGGSAHQVLQKLAAIGKDVNDE